MLRYWHLLEKKNGVWKSSANPKSGNFGTLKRNGHSSTENQKSFFSPSLGGGTMLSAAVLHAYSPPSPPTPTPAPHQAPVNSCILILVNTHVCLSFQSLSVKHHFFGKGPEVVLSEFIFFKV